MEMIDLTDIVGAVAVFVLTMLVLRFIPYLKAKVGQQNYEEIKMWVKIAVQAAEMIFQESGLGEKKKQYVLEFLQSKGFTIDFDELDAMIESAVLELNQGKVE